jgi:hypothetical protein
MFIKSDRSHPTVIRVFDEAGNIVETEEHTRNCLHPTNCDSCVFSVVARLDSATTKPRDQYEEAGVG